MKDNFKSKLHLICSKDEKSRYNCVWFKNGYAYATDGHIAIRQALKLHDFTEEGIKNLEGKAIHRRLFEELLRYDLIVPEKDHIRAIKKGCFAKFEYSICDYEFPDIEKMIKEISSEKVNEIKIDFNLIEKLNKALINGIESSRYKLKFSGEGKGIIISDYLSNNESEQMAILMPCI